MIHAFSPQCRYAFYSTFNILFVGGWHASTENTNKVECYDPVKDTWNFVKPMLERRYQPGVAVVEGKIYVAGGEEGWDRYLFSLTICKI